MAELERADVEVVVTTAQVMAVVSPVRSSSAIVAIAPRPAADAGRLYAGVAPLVLIAHDVQDPGNLGAIVRAAEAGQATSVIAAGGLRGPLRVEGAPRIIRQRAAPAARHRRERRRGYCRSATPRLPRRRHRPARGAILVSTSTCAVPRPS